jgi:hypothetical protein
MDVGIDFRATSGYVTDPANCTYDINETYPVTRGGVTFGWDGTQGAPGAGGSRDRDTGVDPRLAGCNQPNGGADGPSMSWQIDVPPGTYAIHLAAGEFLGNSTTNQITFKDGGTVLFTVNSDLTFPFWDAGAASFANAAAWVLGEVAQPVLMAGSSLTLVLGDGTHNAKVAHVRITSASGAFAVPSGSPQQVIAGWGWR